MDKKALTLLEILVSCMLLAFVLTGLANVFVIGKRYTLHSRSRIQVAELGKFYLEPLQAQVSQDEWGNNCLSRNGLNPAGCDTTPWTDPTTNITYSVNYQNSAWTVGGADLRKVILTITWNEPPT